MQSKPDPKDSWADLRKTAKFLTKETIATIRGVTIHRLAGSLVFQSHGDQTLLQYDPYHSSKEEDLIFPTLVAYFGNKAFWSEQHQKLGWPCLHYCLPPLSFTSK